MVRPIRPVSNEQMLAFGRRVCAYIGVDPAVVVNDTSFNWTLVGGDKFGFVDLRVAIPGEDLLAMFNGEDRTRKVED